MLDALHSATLRWPFSGQLLKTLLDLSGASAFRHMRHGPRNDLTIVAQHVRSRLRRSRLLTLQRYHLCIQSRTVCHTQPTTMRPSPTWHYCDFSCDGLDELDGPPSICALRSSPLPPTTLPTTSPTQSRIRSCSTPPLASTKSPKEASTSSRFLRINDLFLLAERR